MSITLGLGWSILLIAFLVYTLLSGTTSQFSQRSCDGPSGLFTRSNKYLTLFAVIFFAPGDLSFSGIVIGIIPVFITPFLAVLFWWKHRSSSYLHGLGPGATIKKVFIESW